MARRVARENIFYALLAPAIGSSRSVPPAGKLSVPTCGISRGDYMCGV